MSKGRWAVWGVLLLTVWCSPPELKAMEPNRPLSEDVENGKLLFRKYCAGCHGETGQGQGYRILGNNPANLTLQATRDKSDAELLATIHEGKPNMPPWKTKLTDRDSRDVLAYVRALAR